MEFCFCTLMSIFCGIMRPLIPNIYYIIYLYVLFILFFNMDILYYVLYKVGMC